MDPKNSHGPDRIDYQETGDLSDIHAALEREHPEPTAETTPVPLWLIAVCGAAICWAGIYLGLFHGGFRADVFNERLTTPELLFPSATKSTVAITDAGPVSLIVLGKGVYANCVPCHQATGTGVAGQFPPLSKSEWALGSEKRLVAILLKGLQGPIAVEGANFNGAMPAWEKTLSDKKIAAVATFIRGSFGNTAPEISEAKVAAARAEFAAKADNFTAAQLEAIPPEATLPDAAGAAPATGAPVPAAGSPAPAPAPVPSSSPGPQATAPSITTPQPPSAAAPAVNIAAGKTVYMTICVACHQPTGMGLPMVFPPLAKSPYVNGAPDRLVAMVLKGNIGAMTIDGKPYNNMMPPQEMMLSDEKIAQVTSYVRANFGNSALPITPDMVAAVRKKLLDRKTPWTQPELDVWKTDDAAVPQK